MHIEFDVDANTLDEIAAQVGGWVLAHQREASACYVLAMTAVAATVVAARTRRLVRAQKTPYEPMLPGGLSYAAVTGCGYGSPLTDAAVEIVRNKSVALVVVVIALGALWVPAWAATTFVGLPVGRAVRRFILRLLLGKGWTEGTANGG